jgi:Flp pilus assembly protein TadB
MFLRNREQNHAREVAFLMPLTLESLILLVESGLGILPAIQRLVAGSTQTKVHNTVIRYLRLVYELAAHGTPLGTALAHVADATELRVLRHVLLHLDISGTEGGELVPALRNLSNHAHTDWRLSVENRVRRLENLVVFPVFVSVIGLMCLTAAVPLVPVLKLKESLQRQSVVPGESPQTGAQPFVIKQ